MPRSYPPSSGHHAVGSARFAPTLTTVLAAAVGCVSDVELDEEDQNIDPGAVTRSIFDATNPNPVIQRIPSPTALAQEDPADADEDGLFGPVDFEATAPEPCEGQTSASCLPLVARGGWPTDVFPELFFSTPILTETASRGILLFEVQDNGAPAPLEIANITQTPLEAPPAACPASEDDLADFTSTIRVGIEPSANLAPNTTYLIFATTALRGAPRTDDEGNEGDPREVEPSSLFFLLVQNGPRPVTVDGSGTFSINGPLQAQVNASVRAAVGEDAPDEVFEAAFQESAEALFGLQRFFRGLAEQAEAAGLSRDQLVFANAWSTGGSGRDAFEKVVFAPDPDGPDSQIPFPSVPLVTTSTIDAGGAPDVINDIPVPDDGSPVVELIFNGLNSLNGFGTTTPIALSTTAPIDPMTAPDNVLFVPYDPTTNTAIGAPVPVRVEGSDMPTGTDADGRDVYALTVQPLEPLRPDTFYALGITSGLRDASGGPFIQDDTFLTLAQTSTNTIAQIVSCGIFGDTGSFPSQGELQQQLQLIEQGLERPRWQPAFEVFENLDPAVSRDQLAIAVPYKTQDITRTLDVVDTTLLPGVYPTLDDETGRDPVVELPLPTIDPTNPNPLGYVGQEAQIFVCSQLCGQGLFEIPFGGSAPIARDQCLANIPALLSHAACQLNASDIDEVRLFDIRHYTLTDGNPQIAGTFTEGSVAEPDVDRMQVWYLAGGAGDPPAAGRPVAVFKHGLGANKETGLLIANSLAQANDEGGWATLLVDLPFHGARASDIADNATGEINITVDPGVVTCNTDPTSPDFRTCTRGADGQQDPSGTGFLGLNVFATRDNFRQAVVDDLTLFDHVRSGRFGDAVQGDLELDGSRIGYVGQSLGGITGGNTAAYAEDLEAVALNTAGGGLTTILLNSVPDVSEPLLEGLVDLEICIPVDPDDLSRGCQPTADFNQFILLAQIALEPGDPLATATGVPQGVLGMRPALGSDRVLQQVALPDPVIANETSFALGGAYGFVDLMAMPPMPTSLRFQLYDFTTAPRATGCHGFLLQPGDPIGGFCGTDINDAVCNTYGAQAQAAGFLDSAGMSVPNQQPEEIELGPVLDPIACQ